MRLGNLFRESPKTLEGSLTKLTKSDQNTDQLRRSKIFNEDVYGPSRFLLFD